MSTEYRNLIAAIIRQTVKDWVQDQHSELLREYLDSDEFAYLIEAIGLDSHYIRTLIKTNQFDSRKLRAAYR